MIQTVIRVLTLLLLGIALGFGIVLLNEQQRRSITGVYIYEPLYYKQRAVEDRWYAEQRFVAEALHLAPGYEAYGFMISVSAEGTLHAENLTGTTALNLVPAVVKGQLKWTCTGHSTTRLPPGCEVVPAPEAGQTQPTVTSGEDVKGVP